MTKTKSKAARTTKHRASWKGPLTFGLVSFPVEAFNALDRESGDIHFHQIHAPCHSRIRYQKVCPIHGDVPNDEIVSGYEVRKGRYIEVDPGELEALRPARDRALKVEAFVPPGAVDPLYFDGRMYYLAPAGAEAREPYAVLAEAMTREGRYGVGRILFSGKEQVALVRPLDGVLHMALLNFAGEIRRPAAVVAAAKLPAGASRQVRLAQSLIEEWADDRFDFSQYVDTYREQVAELIAAKAKGHEVVEPVEEEPAPVLSFQEALRQSLSARRRHRPRRRTA